MKQWKWQRKCYEAMNNRIQQIINAWNIEEGKLMQIYDSAWQVGEDFVLKTYKDVHMLQRNIKILTILEEMRRIIESARCRAMEQKKKKRKAKEAFEITKTLEKMAVKPGDEAKTKEQLQKDLESREKLQKEEPSEVLANYKISQMQILDSYSPMYEFED